MVCSRRENFAHSLTKEKKMTKRETAAAAAFKPVSTGVDEVLEASRQVVAGRTKTSTAAPKVATAEITGNPFHKIMFDPSMGLEQKREAMTNALTFDKSLTEEQNAQRLHSFVEFSEWLQSKRKELAIDMLKLNDSEAFAQLKEVIDELGQGILDFNKKIQPFLNILDSLYKMQLKGVKTSDMLGEIIKDREELERLNGELDGYERDMDGSERSIRDYNDMVAELKTETSWWSFGTKIKPSAQAEINKIELRVAEEREKMGRLATKIQDTQTAIDAPRVTQFEGLEDVKYNLTTLLDISSDAHREKQKELNQTAADFVTTSDQRVAAVLKNIESMNTRIEGAGKNSSKVLGLYAVMNDSIKAAIRATKSGMTLLMEVKGYPSVSYSDPNRAHEIKKTSPTLQASHWYAHAILKCMRLKTEYPDAKVAIGIPNFKRYRDLFEETKGSLEKIEIQVWSLNESGKVEIW